MVLVLSDRSVRGVRSNPARLKTPLPALPATPADESSAPLTPALLNYESSAGRPFAWSLPRFWQLVLYALASAAVDGATAGNGVPRHVVLPNIFLPAVLLFGPIHLALTLPTEWISQRIWNLFRVFSYPDDDVASDASRSNIVGFFVALVCVCVIAWSFPTAFAVASDYMDNIRERQTADGDRAQHRARIFCDFNDPRAEYFVSDIRIQRYYDRGSGLELHNNFHKGFESGYNARILEKLRAEPHPPWASFRNPPTDDVILAMLESRNMSPAWPLPFTINPNITISSNTVMTPSGVFGSSAVNVWFARRVATPGIVFIRFDRNVLYVFADDGTPLATAVR